MQLDLLTKMRENKIYENREKFARHANQPASFSSLQMQEYLKASAFRRDNHSLSQHKHTDILLIRQNCLCPHAIF